MVRRDDIGRRAPRALAVVLAAGLCLAACGGDGRPERAGGGHDRTGGAPATPAATPTPEPSSCPGGGRLIAAVEIPAVHSDPVRIPEAVIGGQRIPAVTIPGVDIPARRVPAQCVEHRPAPGGCLGAVSIPGTSIPAVTIPAVRIPGVKARGIDAPAVEQAAVSSEAVSQPAVSSAEVCQSKPSKTGEYVSSVYRSGVYRSGLYRSSAYRSGLYRPRTCNDQGECLPSVSVPSVTAPGVNIPGVSVPGVSLKSYVAGPGQVIKGDDSIAYNIEADVLFDFGEAEIKPAAAAELGKIAKSLGEEVPDGATVQVDGHTDAKGDTASNQALSLRRAQAIVDWLAAEGGIARSRLKATGYGETKPASPNTKPDGSDDPEGRAKNRRVVISAAR